MTKDRKGAGPRSVSRMTFKYRRKYKKARFVTTWVKIIPRTGKHLVKSLRQECDWCLGMGRKKTWPEWRKGGKVWKEMGLGWGWWESTESDSLSGHSGFTNVMVYLTKPRNSLGRVLLVYIGNPSSLWTMPFLHESSWTNKSEEQSPSSNQVLFSTEKVWLLFCLLVTVNVIITGWLKVLPWLPHVMDWILELEAQSSLKKLPRGRVQCSLQTKARAVQLEAVVHICVSWFQKWQR